MIDFISFLTKESDVVAFMLLFMRFSGIIAFYPFFDYPLISNSVKAGLAFFLTVVCFPSVTLASDFDTNSIMLAVVSELTFGLVTGLILKFVFLVMNFAGELISFVMGFTMASAYDPSLQNQTPIIGQMLGTLALVIFLAFDGHHLVLMFVNHSLTNIPLGEFRLHINLFDYLNKAMINFFVVGFSLAFPIIALSLLSDIIFGMIMKTNPQFNLLVIGFPVKIIIGFVVFMASIGGIMVVFKKEFQSAFDALTITF